MADISLNIYIRNKHSHVGTSTSATLVERKYRRFVYYANNSSSLSYGGWERADYPSKVTAMDYFTFGDIQLSFCKCRQNNYDTSPKDENTLYLIVE